MSGRMPPTPPRARLARPGAARHEGWEPLARVAPLGCLAAVFAVVVSRTSNGLAWVAVLLACALLATAYLLGPQLVAAEVRSEQRRDRRRPPPRR